MEIFVFMAVDKNRPPQPRQLNNCRTNDRMYATYFTLYLGVLLFVRPLASLEPRSKAAGPIFWATIDRYASKCQDNQARRVNARRSWRRERETSSLCEQLLPTERNKLAGHTSRSIQIDDGLLIAQKIVRCIAFVSRVLFLGFFSFLVIPNHYANFSERPRYHKL